MTNMNRRNAIGAMGMGIAGAAALGQAKAADLPPALPPAFSGGHQPQPLKFDPAKLTGLSEKLIRSHYDNNYIGSVRTLNMIEGRLAAAMADKDLPPVVYGGLKREELHRTGSVILHELYFGALGGNGVAAGDIRTALGALSEATKHGRPSFAAPRWHWRAALAGACWRSTSTRTAFTIIGRGITCTSPPQACRC